MNNYKYNKYKIKYINYKNQHAGGRADEVRYKVNINNPNYATLENNKYNVIDNEIKINTYKALIKNKQTKIKEYQDSKANSNESIETEQTKIKNNYKDGIDELIYIQQTEIKSYEDKIKEYEDNIKKYKTRNDELIEIEQTEINERKDKINKYKSDFQIYVDNHENDKIKIKDHYTADIDKLIEMEQTKIQDNMIMIAELSENQRALNKIIDEDPNFNIELKNPNDTTVEDTRSNVLQRHLKISDDNLTYFSLTLARYSKLLQTIKDKNTTQTLSEEEKLFNEISIQLIEEEIETYNTCISDTHQRKTELLDENNDSTKQSRPTIARANIRVGRSKSSSALRFTPISRQSSSALRSTPSSDQSSSSRDGIRVRLLEKLTPLPIKPLP